MKFKIDSPKKYRKKEQTLKVFLKSPISPLTFVNKFYSELDPVRSVNIKHKPIQYSAEYKTPQIILVDFRNDISYIALSIAHEYTHLLLRKNKIFRDKGVPEDQNVYSFDQGLAIFTQLSYEDYANIRPFTKKTIFELAKYMHVNMDIAKKIYNDWNKKKLSKKIISPTFLNNSL